MLQGKEWEVNTRIKLQRGKLKDVRHSKVNINERKWGKLNTRIKLQRGKCKDVRNILMLRVAGKVNINVRKIGRKMIIEEGKENDTLMEQGSVYMIDKEKNKN